MTEQADRDDEPSEPRERQPEGIVSRLKALFGMG